MTRKWTLSAGTGALSALFLCAAGIVCAQAPQSGQSQPPQQQQPPAQDNKEPNPAPLKMDNAPPPASPEEETAYKDMQAASDIQKKIQLAEGFLQKYPQSRYRAAAYQNLVSGYYATQQIPKMLDAGEKEIELNPNDAAILAVVAQTLARTYKPTDPDAAQRLEKAEQYSKKAIEVTPTLPKPEGMTDETFVNAKSDALTMAHSGLGLVYIRRGKFAEAIPELEESIKDDRHPDPDPVNYYLLGIADKQTSHFDKAAQAFTKCASVQGGLQAACKANADDAKKQGSTQLSAPN